MTQETKLSINKNGIVSVDKEIYDLIGDQAATQNYVRTAVHATIKELGFDVKEEWEMDDDSIELTVIKWK